MKAVPTMGELDRTARHSAIAGRGYVIPIEDPALTLALTVEVVGQDVRVAYGGESMTWRYHEARDEPVLHARQAVDAMLVPSSSRILAHLALALRTAARRASHT